MAGTLTISTLSDGTNSTSSTNCIKGSSQAWVRYNGTAQTITSSYNVSSVTYNSTGDYTVNFTTALADANYLTLTTSLQGAAGQTLWIKSGGTYTSSAVQVLSGNNSASTNTTNFSIACFR